MENVSTYLKKELIKYIKQEVEKGSNPLCPDGKDCGEFGVDVGVIPISPALGTSTVNQGDESALSDLQKALTDPAQIRKMLIASGVEKKVVDATSDKELLRMVEEMTSATGAVKASP